MYLGILFPSLKTDKRLIPLKKSILPLTGKYFDILQAIFDLAASICKKEPLCNQCPLKKHCKTSTKFISGAVRAPKKQTEQRSAFKKGKTFQTGFTEEES